MTQGHFGKVLQYLRWRVEPPAGEQTDRQLLQRFALGRDQDAFAALVRRHGPMVLAVGRRMLHDAAAADDAFQATFLVLARKAAAPGWAPCIGSWLYQVAYRCASKIRVSAARRRRHESQVTDMPAADSLAVAEQRELRSLLDDELSQLPEKYRAPLVLCYLEGKSNEEAAQLLNWPVGTVYSRLARARELLRTQLSRRGLALPASAVAAELAAQAAPAAVPAALLDSTVKAAATGAAGLISGPAAAVAEGVVHAMFVTRLKIAGLLVLAVTLVAGGAGWFTYRTLAGGGTPVALAPLPEQPPARPAEAQPSEPVEHDGLQVTVKPAKAVFGLEEALVFTMIFKNVSKKDFTFLHAPMADRRNDWFGFRKFHVAGMEPGSSWDVRMRPETMRLFMDGLPALPPPHVLKAGQTLEVTVKFDDSYAFYWTGNRDAARPAKPDLHLPFGKHRLTIDLMFYGGKDRPLPPAAAGVAGDVEKRLANKPPLWVGELTTKPVEFEIAAANAGKAISKPVRVNGVDFEAVADKYWTVPKAGENTKVNLDLRITNHTDKEILFNLFDTILPRLQTADGKQQWVGAAERSATAPCPPVAVAAGKSVIVSRPATLRRSPQNEQMLRLFGGDGSGGVWVMDGLKPGTYRFSLTYENRHEKTDFFKNAQPFWVGKAQTEEADVAIAAPVVHMQHRQGFTDQLVRVGESGPPAELIVHRDGFFCLDGRTGRFPQAAIDDLVEQIIKSDPTRPRKDAGSVTFVWIDKDGKEQKKILQGPQASEDSQKLLDKIVELARQHGDKALDDKVPVIVMRRNPTFGPNAGKVTSEFIVERDGSFRYDGRTGKLPAQAVADLIEQIVKADLGPGAEDAPATTFTWKDKDGKQQQKTFTHPGAPDLQKLLDQIAKLARLHGEAKK